MLKKIALALAGLTLLTSPLLVSAQIALPPLPANPTIEQLETLIVQLTQILAQLIAARGGADSAAFSASPTSGPGPLYVNFQAKESLADTTQLTLYFGDGTTCSGYNCIWHAMNAGMLTASHTYTSAGTYTANLTGICSTTPPTNVHCSVPIYGTATIRVIPEFQESKALTLGWSNKFFKPVNNIGLDLAQKICDASALLYPNGTCTWKGNNLTPRGVKDGDPHITMHYPLSNAYVIQSNHSSFSFTDPSATDSSDYRVLYVRYANNSAVGDIYEVPFNKFGRSGAEVNGDVDISRLPNGNYYPGVVNVSSGIAGSVGAYVFLQGNTANTAGTLTVSTDASSPPYQVVAAPSTNVRLGVYRLRASGEAIGLNKIVFSLGEVPNPGDLTQVRLMDSSGSVIAAGVFTNNQYAYLTPTHAVTIPANTDVTVTLWGDIAGIGAGQPAKPGDLLAPAIQPDTQGTGQSSAATINASGSTPVVGVRIFRSYPTVALVPLPSTGLSDGRLLRFAVTASPAGPVGFVQLGFTVNTMGVMPNGQIDLYAYTDPSYSSPVSGQFTAGFLGSAPLVGSGGFTRLGFAHILEIPAAATYYFELRDSTKGTGPMNGSLAVTTLDGENGYQSLSVYNAAYVNGPLMAWSPNDLVTSVSTDGDWTNGYGLPGLPAGGISQTRAGSAAPSISASPSSGSLSNGTLWVSTLVSNYTPQGNELVDFGDGSRYALGYLSQLDNRHDYHSPGTYTVRLLDGSGNTLSTTMVTVSSTSGLTASLTVNGGSSATIHRNDPTTFAWSSTNAVSAASSYTADSADSCGHVPGVAYPWIVSTLSGAISVANAVDACQTGTHSYTITYTVTDAQGRTASASIRSTVSVPAAPSGLTASLTVNGSSASQTFNVGDILNFAWSSTGAVSAHSSFTSDSSNCGNTGIGPFNWVASTLGGTYPPAAISACQAGHSYTITYTVTGSNGQTASASVTTTVRTSCTYSPAGGTSSTINIDGGSSACSGWCSSQASGSNVTYSCSYAGAPVASAAQSSQLASALTALESALKALLVQLGQ